MTTYNRTEADAGTDPSMHPGDIVVLSMQPPSGYYNWTITNPTPDTNQSVLEAVAIGMYPPTQLTSRPPDWDDHRTLEAFRAFHTGDLEIRAAASSVSHPTTTIDFHRGVHVSNR